jgi:hypothetical protein
MIYLINPQDVEIAVCVLKTFCTPKYIALYGVDPT